MKKNSGLFGRYLNPNITVNTSGKKDYFDLFLSLIMYSKDNLIYFLDKNMKRIALKITLNKQNIACYGTTCTGIYIGDK